MAFAPLSAWIIFEKPSWMSPLTRHMLPTALPQFHTPAIPSAQTEWTIGRPVALIASLYSRHAASPTGPLQASTSIRSAPHFANVRMSWATCPVAPVPEPTQPLHVVLPMSV